ncbi:MAG: flagellar biosynthesis protein FlhF [Gallionellales bacterium RIFCSPHIGHO2_02_FULL_57_16]|nr:MAG: flagellar biosynthesis protein FlhF [Gallionellales bacterium RBG_16_57_15]OGT16108.1 MAG: flagellar biosynthesis protein FlhF [Gallionellales bacterium RIFCSPHIGHO2_02_FULL_57_16]
MNIRKFVAPTARQALKDIRNELGDDAVILSNRNVVEGVEIIALANDEQLSGIRNQESGVGRVPTRPLRQAQDGHVGLKPGLPATAPQPSILDSESSILVEMKSMHSMLRQQLAALSWSDVQQRDPQRAALLCRILNSGFSASLARQLLDKMPAGNAHGESWVKRVLKRNLQVAGAADDIVVKGGVYALIGPTGVGKTTTTAKLAARAVVRYGADKVALLTTDSYRIGAYEQLKIYGKILGVAVHAVKDTDDLRLTLSALRHKHLVLVDTVGMGQRDERVGDQKKMFDATGVERLLLLNATSGGDTLEDAVRMYHSKNVIGCVVTKLDEAANLGAVLDVAVRHRLVLHYMANGQRVPEDLHSINPDYLLHRALKPAEEKTPFTLNELELPALMAAEGSPPGGNGVSRPPGSQVSGGVLLAGAGTPGREVSYAL